MEKYGRWMENVPTNYYFCKLRWKMNNLSYDRSAHHLPHVGVRRRTVLYRPRAVVNVESTKAPWVCARDDDELLIDVLLLYKLCLGRATRRRHPRRSSHRHCCDELYFYADINRPTISRVRPSCGFFFFAFYYYYFSFLCSTDSPSESPEQF